MRSHDVTRSCRRRSGEPIEDPEAERIASGRPEHRGCSIVRSGRPSRLRLDWRSNMCRWLAYSGSPVLLEELLYKPAHSLIDQSLHSRLGATTTNGDGFGIGWYGVGDTPGGLPRDRAGVERPQPPRSRRPHLLSARVRAHPGLDRHRDPADELPPLPPRALAVDAQRRDPRVPARQARAGVRRRSVALRRRSRGRPTRSCSSSSRSRSVSRTTRRSPSSGPSA